MLAHSCLASAAPSPPQDRRTSNPRRPEAAYIDHIDAGWNGRTASDRWNPVTVWLGGGEKGFTGLLSLVYQQDATQEARLLIPAAATPGATTPVDLSAALPHGLGHIEISLLDQSGRAIDEVTASIGISEPGDLLLDLTWPELGSPVISAGPCSIVRALHTQPAAPIPPGPRRYIADPDSEPRLPPATVWNRLAALAVDPARMPRAWSAYEAIPALVIDAASMPRIEPRARQAIQQWLLGGGRVVMIASTGGAEWRSLLPPGPEYDLFNLADPRTLDTPSELTEGVDLWQQELAGESLGPAATPSEGQRSQDQPGQDPASQDQSDQDPPAGAQADSESDQTAQAPPDPTAPPTPARTSPATKPDEPRTHASAKVSGRPITLTAQGLACGWKLRWNSAPGSTSLLAQGPAGFGRLTVLGVDPEKVPQSLSQAASSAVWYDAMRDVAQAVASSRPSFDSWNGSGQTSAQSESYRAALNELVGDRTIGIAGLIPVWLSMGLLALCLGPVDAIVLKRLGARQRSWATALGWIALVSAAAAYVPGLIRTAPTTLDRVRVLDIRHPLAGQGEPLAWQSGVSALFGGRAEDVALTGFAPGTWVRGISAIGSAREARHVLTPFTTVQVTADDGKLPALTNAPSSMWLGQWTMRGFADQGQLASFIGGRTRPATASDNSASPPWTIDLWGLQPDAFVTRVLLETGSLTRGSILATAELGRATPDGKWSITLSASQRASSESIFPTKSPGYGSTITAGHLPGILGRLPGADTRSRAMAELVASGRWALVTLMVRDNAGSASVQGHPDLGNRWSLVRLCLPLDSSGAGETP